MRCNYRTNIRRSAEHLLASNVVQGNTLTGLNDSGAEIEFSWWHRVLNVPGTVQREPFTFISLRGANAIDFTVYERYVRCRIDHVHKEVRADA